MQANREQIGGITRRRLMAAAARATAGAAVLASPAVVSSTALGATAFPRGTWPQANPRSVGMSVDKLLEAKAAAKKYGTGAGCVIRHGLVVFRWGDFDQRFLIQSATKSWGSVLLGLALDAGKFGLGDKVIRHLPNLGAKPTSNTRTGWLDDITFEQLATHTGGFPEPSGYSALQAKPGTTYIYSNCGTNWLANAITNRFRQDLRVLASDRLFHPLWLSGKDIAWRTPAIFFTDKVYGLPATEFNGGITANVNAMARLGYLFLHGGNWNGLQIVSKSFVALATKPYFAKLKIDTLQRYGLLWFNNGAGSLAGVPRNAFWATGLNNNHVFVLPSQDVVAVRLGTDGWTNHGGNHGQFLKPIVDAVIS